jgi:hypothetical protein
MSERTEFINISIENIAKVLALLATQRNHIYIDKLGYISSKDSFISFEHTNHV